MSNRKTRGRRRAPVPPTLPPSARPRVRLTVEVVEGDITCEPSPVTVVGRFDGVPLSGADRQFDRILMSWLSMAVELGAVGSRLGELFFIPIPDGVTETGLLVLAGMGEPGHFGRDELRYLMTNVAFGVIALGHREFCTLLIGSGSGGLVGRRALMPLLEGVADALARMPSHTTVESLRITLVERRGDQAARYHEALRQFARQAPFPDVDLVVTDTVRVQPGAPMSPTAPPPEEDPIIPTTRVTVLMPPPTAPAVKEALRPRFVRLQYSALGEGAMLPVREVEVQEYFTRRLPGTLAGEPLREDDQERYGRLLTGYLVPEDIRQLMFDSPALTLVVDRRTAAFPWEMAALEHHGAVRFLGVGPGVSRQFRALTTGGQAAAPPLNTTLRVLVIADPAPAPYHLPGARDEGLAVVEVMRRVQEFWGDALDLKVTVRIGPPEGPGRADARTLLAAARAFGDVVESARPCEPMEVLSLIANRVYDVIHYAGHGIYDAKTGRSGWVFGADCVFSAAELMRARRVPRLVFANACHSSHLDAEAGEQQLGDQATLAEAFFARGVPNYIGTGWEVDDAAARRLAESFYRRALGEIEPQAPPAVLGEALRDAREEIRRADDSSWGAYQHYGQWNDKLLPLPNRDALG